MNSSITFAQFDAAMQELGFRIEAVKGSHVNYWHDGWDKPYMTQFHKPKDLVPVTLSWPARESNCNTSASPPATSSTKYSKARPRSVFSRVPLRGEGRGEGLL